MPIEPRQKLKEFFETGDIPTQDQFYDLIDSYVHRKEDGVYIDEPDAETKRFGIGIPKVDSPLGIKAAEKEERLISLYDSSDRLRWSMNLNPSKIQGLNFSQQQEEGGVSRLFISDTKGYIGVGTTDPDIALDVRSGEPGGLSGLSLRNNSTLANEGWKIGHINEDDSDRDGALVFRSQRPRSQQEFMLITTEGRVGVNAGEPDSRLHVDVPSGSGKGVINLAPGTGIVEVGSVLSSTLLDFRGIQARKGEFIGETLNLEVDALNLQRLGGDLIIHDGGKEEEKLIFNSTGLLGVGTVTPSERLDLAGAIRLGNSLADNEGTIRWNGTDFEGRTANGWESLTGANGTGLWSQGANDTIYYAAGSAPRIAIGSDQANATIHINDTESVSGANKAAIVNNQSSTSGTGADDHRIGLEVSASGTWEPSASAKNVGIYVSQATGQPTQEANLAAVLNGNTVVGDIISGESAIGQRGTNVFAIQNGIPPSSVPSSQAIQLYSAQVDSFPTLHLMNGNGDVITFKKESAMTARDETAFPDTYDPDVIKPILNNMRTRINELEDKLKSIGLLA